MRSTVLGWLCTCLVEEYCCCPPPPVFVFLIKEKDGEPCGKDQVSANKGEFNRLLSY